MSSIPNKPIPAGQIRSAYFPQTFLQKFYAPCLGLTLLCFLMADNVAGFDWCHQHSRKIDVPEEQAVLFLKGGSALSRKVTADTNHAPTALSILNAPLTSEELVYALQKNSSQDKTSALKVTAAVILPSPGNVTSLLCSIGTDTSVFFTEKQNAASFSIADTRGVKAQLKLQSATMEPSVSSSLGTRLLAAFYPATDSSSLAKDDNTYDGKSIYQHFLTWILTETHFPPFFSLKASHVLLTKKSDDIWKADFYVLPAGKEDPQWLAGIQVNSKGKHWIHVNHQFTDNHSKEPLSLLQQKIEQLKNSGSAYAQGVSSHTGKNKGTGAPLLLPSATPDQVDRLDEILTPAARQVIYIAEIDSENRKSRHPFFNVEKKYTSQLPKILGETKEKMLKMRETLKQIKNTQYSDKPEKSDCALVVTAEQSGSEQTIPAITSFAFIEEILNRAVIAYIDFLQKQQRVQYAATEKRTLGIYYKRQLYESGRFIGKQVVKETVASYITTPLTYALNITDGVVNQHVAWLAGSSSVSMFEYFYGSINAVDASWSLLDIAIQRSALTGGIVLAGSVSAPAALGVVGGLVGNFTYHHFFRQALKDMFYD